MAETDMGMKLTFKFSEYNCHQHGVWRYVGGRKT
jgi:hypothetical protein